MFDGLLKACKALEKVQTLNWEQTSDDLVDLVPDSVTAQDVKGFLSEDGEEKLSPIATLWAVHAGILKIVQDVRNGKRDVKDGSYDTLIEVADRISTIILPVCDGVSSEDDVTDYAALQQKANLGLVTLCRLTKALPGGPSQLPASTHLRLTAFTNRADPWTSDATHTLSNTLLLPLEAPERRDELTRLITEHILMDFLRPLFSKSRPAAVTASGRKAEFVEPSRYDGTAAESPETKPWKYGCRYAVTVFAWAVRQADSELLQKHWHLYTPVLLTLLDESQPAALQIRALGLLRAFWARCPAGLMRQTGLADVFEHAAFPALLYLPSLTPENDSLLILGAAYPALIEMAGLTADYPGADPRPREGLSPGAGSKREPQQQLTEAQRKLLDKIIREGILVGYHHAKEHIRIVGLLCETLVCIINGMGILAVKHLKDLIPMASEIMADPFGTKYPPALMAAAKLLQAILRTCWPRIPHYCNEIIKILMLCWLNVDDEESLPPSSPTASELKSELTKTADMLFAVMKVAQADLSERVEPLIEKEPQLSKLFRVRDSG
ncbi:hypothetical protein F4818DRAFT_440970 [Hypoxylon cercidicola]|nr:hypothetical protein F4818DRAFT_440970 [Hypoxylon cercidicola]